MERKFTYITNVNELYDEVRDMMAILASGGEEKWSKALDRAMREGATGLEITGSIRVVLRDLKLQGLAEKLGLGERLERCVRYINYIWDDPYREGTPADES